VTSTTAHSTETVATRYAGTRVPRVEDTRLLTGKGTFVDDVQRPGMLHACFVRSPFARATINGIDTAAALALPGVYAVFIAEDINACVKEAWHAVAGKDIPDTPRPPLAEGEVKFVGDPVALVIAESRYVAEDAVDLVEVDYEPLPAIADFRKAQGGSAAGVPVVHDAYPDNVAGGMGGAPPDEEIFATSAYVVQEHIYQQMYVPVPMETRGMVAEWASTTAELTVWASTQTPHELRAFAARLLGIPAQGVRVIMRDTGGAFGQKVVPMREDMCILLAARKVPVFGPFEPLMYSPQVMTQARSMGDYLRYKSAIGNKLSELAILVTAREWTQDYEWYVHHPIALKVGIKPEVTEAIAQGRRPVEPRAPAAIRHSRQPCEPVPAPPSP